MRPEKEIFDVMESGLSKILAKDNYKLAETEFHEGTFGSRYSVWKNDKEKYAVRLTWDGKESWFIVEESPFGESDNPISWADNVIVPFDRNVKDEQYFREIIDSVINEMK
jgi:hypothetical protein